MQLRSARWGFSPLRFVSESGPRGWRDSRSGVGETPTSAKGALQSQPTSQALDVGAVEWRPQGGLDVRNLQAHRRRRYVPDQFRRGGEVGRGGSGEDRAP